MAENNKKTVLISGGSRGIGRATALRFAKAGYDIAILYGGNDAAAEEAKDLIRKEAPDAAVFSVKADAASEEEVHAAVASVMEEPGRIDVLVNAAGISRDALLIAAKAEDFDRALAINLRGAFFLSKEVFRPMMKQRAGRIVNISSVVGLHGNVGQAAYAASKAGLIGLTKSVAAEGAKRGILVNAVAPGYVRTDMTAALPGKVTAAMTEHIPLGRGASPEEIAEAVYFLGSEGNTYITGQVLAVDGGMFI